MNKLFLCLFLIPAFTINAQQSDKEMIDAIYKNALSSYASHHNLKELCQKAPGRLMGSKESEIAIELLKDQLIKIQPDTVYLQPYTSPSWRCKSPAQATVSVGTQQQKLNVVNLGLSVSTPAAGIKAEVIEVGSLEELDKIDPATINGKIVFINQKMNPDRFRTFQAYGETAGARMKGAIHAAKKGAIGVIVRSLSPEPDDFPHTGVSLYQEDVKKIPNLSISTNDADKLSNILKQNKRATIHLKSDTETIESTQTANVIAELRGTQHPEKVILIGAHIDAWFNSPGAHDDGAGCVQMMDVLRIFKKLNIKPINTIRVVLYMDEEMYQSGAKTYAEAVAVKKENDYPLYYLN